jgi:hypothetical protein
MHPCASKFHPCETAVAAVISGAYVLAALNKRSSHLLQKIMFFLLYFHHFISLKSPFIPSFLGETFTFEWLN